MFSVRGSESWWDMLLTTHDISDLFLKMGKYIEKKLLIYAFKLWMFFIFHQLL